MKPRKMALRWTAARWAAGLFGICLVIGSCKADGLSMVDLVLVKKSERRMYLFDGDSMIREYRIALGANPTGHKQREGDERTPEGRYTLDYKNADSDFYKSIHISYPNANDRRRARRKGVDPGGHIVIHGQGDEGIKWRTPKLDWTDGCIGVTNREMDEIWELVREGTSIQILP